MRLGEIVQDWEGRLGAFAREDCDAGGLKRAVVCRHGEESWLDYDECEIVTVAELFEAAGHSVPGLTLVRLLCIEWSIDKVSASPRDIWTSKPEPSAGNVYWEFEGEWRLIEKPRRDDGTVGIDQNGDEITGDWMLWKAAALCFGIDLSRLPAMDAWDALPEVVKAVVK